MDIEVSANPRPSFWKSGFSKFSAALCFFISVGSVAMVAAADDGYVMLENGVYCRTADGRMRVEFVSPDIVRVRYTREADFLGNGTIVCVERTENKVPFQVASVSGGLSLQSDSLEVRVDLNTCALTYKDARTGKVLLSERQDMPREAEKTYMENGRRREGSDGRASSRHGGVDLEVQESFPLVGRRGALWFGMPHGRFPRLAGQDDVPVPA